MISDLSFENKELLLAVVLTGLALFVIFIWKSWNGKKDRRFLFQTLLGFIALLSLAMLTLKPTYLKKVTGEAVLLTDGYNKETLDSIKKRNRKVSILDYKPGMDLTRTLDSIKRFLIIGYGVRDYDLWQFKKGQVTFLPEEISDGIVQLKYNQMAMLGEDLKVQGIYKAPTLNGKLVLLGPGGNALDSIIFSSNKNHPFTLKANLKASGRFQYALQVKDSTDAIYNTDPLPVIVVSNPSLRILMVNEFPSFETKYLKNFLSEEGHQVIIKTKLTKQKYKFEYFNTERQPINSLNTENLSALDLIVFDDRSLNSLSNLEKTILSGAINKNGLGVFVQQTGNRFQSKNTLGEFETQPNSENTIRVAVSSEPLLEKYPILFDAKELTGLKIGNYGYYKLLGQGRIGATSLKNTYQLLLDGKDAEYKEIWTTLINGIRKQTESTGAFRLETNWTFVNEPYDFSYFTTVGNPVVSLENHYRVPLIKSSVISDKWHGRVYPKAKGWHKLVSELDSLHTQNFYVFEEGNWNSLFNQNTLKNNKRYFDAAVFEEKEKLLPQGIPLSWFFIVFLFSMGLLWLQPKLK